MQASQEGDKPIQKMIKSGSQVLGKCRQRPNITRTQFVKDLNDKMEKNSQYVEQNHQMRVSSNEKTSSTKKSQDFQSFKLTQKYQGSNQRMNQLNMQISDFDFIAKMNAHSEERHHYHPSAQDENTNAINIGNVGQTYQQHMK